MKDVFRCISWLFIFLTLVGAWLYNDQFQSDALLSVVITLGTMAYHFSMRCVVGFCIDRHRQNHIDYSKPWFQPKEWEKPLYEKLRVKQWKRYIPAFHPDLFSPNVHTWDEIIQASCQAEVVHEANALLSLVPISFARWFGSLSVFVITSVAAAAIEIIFIIVQRYNRPRLLRVVNR